MKKIITSILAVFGLSTACGQQNFENADVQTFSQLIEEPNVVVLDVRTADEYAEGHIVGAINIDQGQDDFLSKAKAALPASVTIAVYCRSGRRSANAAGKLAGAGYKCVNLQGGIVAWQDANMPVTTDTYEVDVFETKSGKTVKIHALASAPGIIILFEVGILKRSGTQLVKLYLAVLLQRLTHHFGGHARLHILVICDLLLLLCQHNFSLVLFLGKFIFKNTLFILNLLHGFHDGNLPIAFFQCKGIFQLLLFIFNLLHSFHDSNLLLIFAGIYLRLKFPCFFLCCLKLFIEFTDLPVMSPSTAREKRAGSRQKTTTPTP